MGIFEKVNSKVVTAMVAPGREVLAMKGSMLAYVGDVSFSPVRVGSGSGGFSGATSAVGGMLGRAVAGEQVPLMVAQGQGKVYYGHAGLHVTVVDLDGRGPLTVEADRLVAYEASLQSTVVFLGSQGGIRGAVRGAVSGQGLFTTQLMGQGSACVLSHGGTIALAVRPDRPTSVDPQAYVGHIGQIQVDLSVSAGWRDAVGHGAGEAVQLKLTGQGTVYVQASEQKI